ncbi:hypothetical protein D3C85_681050 [compost metagenome]
MNHTNLKTSIQIKMEIELEQWKAGEKVWNVHNQHHEYILESALENFHHIENLMTEWEKQGTNIGSVSAMDWAFALSEFQPSGLDSEWVD